MVCGIALLGFAATCRPVSSGTVTPSTLQIGVALPRAGGTGIGVQGFVTLLTTESLVGLGWDGRPTPRLAAEWRTEENGHKVRMRLQSNVLFHDNTPFTAKVLRDFFLKTINNPEEPPPLSYSSITDISVVDDDEVEIRLSRPEAFFLSDLIATSVTHPGKREVGTGPYRPVEQKQGSKESAAAQVRSATFEAFPAYYRGRPKTNFIEVKEYATPRNAWAALMRGEVNALHEVNPGGIEFMEKESGVRTYQFLRGYYSFLAFNMAHPVLARREVRQALSHAANREQVIKQAMHGRGQPADGPIWPFHWAYSTAQRGYSYNPEAARLKLDAAGLKMPTTPVTGRMPSRLRFTCLIFDDPRFEQIALVLQKQLFDIGVDMEIQALPIREFVSRMTSGNFDALLGEYTSGRSAGWTYYVWHSSHRLPYTPRTGYSGADAVLDRLRHASSDQEIRTSVGELQRTLYDDPPAIFIAWPYTSRAVSTTFSVPQDATPDIMGNIWQWQAQPQVASR